MLKSFFSISKNQVAVLTTLVILLMLGSSYFFIYLPANEKSLQAQRFRALQNTDRNMHEKISNSAALLNILIKEQDSLQKFTRDSSTSHFTLIQPADTIRPLGLKQNNADSICIIIVDSNSREIIVLLKKTEGKRIGQLGMKFSFEQFISFLLPGNVFDDYIVFSRNRPVYETFPSGISYAIKDSLFSAKRTGISSSLVVNQSISGTDYKMFLQPVSLNSNTELVIAGLLTNERYQNEKNQLPTPVILLLVTILFSMLVAFPLIKIFQMGSKDRLTLTDGILALFISMLLMSLLFFSFFKYNLPERFGEIKGPKETIAKNIVDSFKNEITLSHKKITSLDSLMKADSDLYKINIVRLDKDIIFNDTVKKELDTLLLKTKIKNICAGLDINQAFWLDAGGNETTNWSTGNVNAPHGNFSNREYFKKIIQQRPYILNDSTSQKYYLEQVISWTAGVFRSVVSIPSGDGIKNKVAALSVNMKSLDSVLLPAGYLFSIIDNTGKVLYHSDNSKNLNENLLSEFSESEKLQSSITAKSSGSFTTKYFGRNYHVLAQPVNGLPYFIVVLEDTVFTETRDAEIYSFTISMLLLFFGFLVLQLISIFLVSARRSFFKNQLFDTSWLGPKTSSNKEYVLASSFNMLVIAALFILFNFCSFLQYFFMLLFSVTFVPYFLNKLFALRYKQEKKNALQFKKTALWSLTALICIIDIAAFELLETKEFIGLLLYQLLLISIGLLISRSRENIFAAGRSLREKNKFLKSWNYVNSFAFMGLTRMIITSGIPIVFFYYASYNYEQNLSSRYKHVEFLNKLSGKIPAQGSNLSSNNYPQGVYIDSSWITSLSEIAKNKVPRDMISGYSPEHNNTIEYLKFFRFDVTSEAIAEEKFHVPFAADTSFFFNHLLDSSCVNNNGTITTMLNTQSGNYIQARSANLNYEFPNIFKWQNEDAFLRALLFWMLLIASLVVFYFLICSIVKKIFALHLPDLSGWKDLDNKILADEKLNNLVFVIGLPGSGKKFHILNKIKNGEIKDADPNVTLVYNADDESNNNVFIADLINIPDSSSDEAEDKRWEKYTGKIFSSKNRLIIVNHFEYNIQDSLTNRIKLNFLERLMLDDKCKIIILSTIHPVAFLDSVMSQSLKKEDTTAEPVPGEDLERWHVLLGHYRIVLLPLDLAVQVKQPGKAEVTVSGQVFNMNKEPVPGTKVTIKNTANKITEATNTTADTGDMIKNAENKTITDSEGNFSLITPYELPFTLVIEAIGYVKEEVIVTENDKVIAVELEERFYNWKERIRSETHYTHFLKKMQQAAIDVTIPLSQEVRMEKSDELAFKLQVTSHYFYMYIWQSLTKEEKFLLYDLAEDNLVNSYDNYNLCMLIGKGVIIHSDGMLKLFNKGFRNFILTAIGNTEAMKIKNQIKDNGNWSKLKNPLLLVILAILAFLLTSQEDSYSKIITYLAALGAGVPTVLKIFSVFEKQNGKSV